MSLAKARVIAGTIQTLGRPVALAVYGIGKVRAAELLVQLPQDSRG